MKRIFKSLITIKVIAFISGILWLSSLFFPGLILYNETQLVGYNILFTGWLGPLAGNFAWFANIFFLIAFFKQLLSNRTPLITAALAVIFSIDVIRFSEYLVNEGGATTPIYGYGIGFILWFSALLTLLLSVGLRKFNAVKGAYEVNKFFGGAFCIVSIAVLFGFNLFAFNKALSDREEGNRYEQSFISSHSVMFKRGNVCKTEVNDPNHKIVAERPIEIVDKGNNWPFNSPEQPLNWGIPIVRMGEFDYFLSNRNGKYTLAATKKLGEPSGILHSSKEYISTLKITKINLTLISAIDGGNIFSQEWSTEVRGTNIMCPRYHSFPNKNQHPRKLLESSLSGLHINSDKPSSRSPSRAKASFISVRHLKIDEDLKMINYRCPTGIGFLDNNSLKELTNGDRFFNSLKRPFVIGNKFYFPNGFRNQFHRSFCTGDSVYLYGYGRNGKNDENLYVRLSKRGQKLFDEHWYIDFTIKKIGSEIKAKSPYMTIADINETEFTLNIIDQQSSQEFKVKVDLTNNL